MSVTYDTSAENHDSSPATTIAVSITIASGTNRALVVSSASAGGNIISSISGAGATWAASAFGTVAGASSSRGEVWYGTNPSTGAQTVTVTFTAALTDWAWVEVFSFSGVDQNTPLANYISSTTAASPSIVVTTTNGDGAVSNLFDASNNAITISGCTSTIDVSSTVGGGLFGGATHCLASGATTTFNWANSPGSNAKLSQGVDVQQTATSSDRKPLLARFP